jgi:hypothetical protein
MSQKPVEPLPKVPDPGRLEEHGISIPAPTPTGISIPNPWRPENGDSDQQAAAPPADQSSEPDKPNQ